MEEYTICEEGSFELGKYFREGNNITIIIRNKDADKLTVNSLPYAPSSNLKARVETSCFSDKLTIIEYKIDCDGIERLYLKDL